MSTEIDETRISQTVVTASQTDREGEPKIYGMWLRVDDGEGAGDDWLSSDEAIDLRDWISAHFGAPS